MVGLFHRLSSGGCLVAFGVALAALAAPGSAQAIQGQKQVLVLYSTRRDAQIVSVVDRELPRLLAAGLGEPLDNNSEYIDLARFPDPAYQAALHDFLSVKYRGYHFDLVVAIQDAAVEFVARNRKDLFRGTPVVFFANAPVARHIENSTGIVSELQFGGTLALALALQPRVRHVFVVSGAAARDKVYEALARAQLKPFESSLTVVYLAGLATKELETRLATLPADSIVYFLLVYRDGAGENFNPLEFLDRVTAVANAPVYCWVDSVMGHGIVGGQLRDQRAQAAALSHLALRVLRGERADSIPLSSPDLDVNQVDWRQLKRWGISEARVPPGTRINFREPSTWERDRAYILGAGAVLLIQTALIVGLLVQGRRRRRAEEEVRGSEAQLRKTHRRIKDLASRLLSAQESERSRIARELHDDISQQLALLTIDLELLDEKSIGAGQRLAGDALNRTQHIAKSLHDLSHRLHPARLRLIGLVAAINGLRQELAQSGIAVTLTHENVPPALPPEVTLCLFRIVQEALQNALKHGRARKVSVE